MKITDDVLRALQHTIKKYGSTSEFARRANVNVNTVRKYINRTSKTITDDTWDKIYPLIRNHLSKKQTGVLHHINGLSSNERILLDAFSELPPDLQEKKVLEIVEMAKMQMEKNKKN
jgi:predicted transcriptional regulator